MKKCVDTRPQLVKECLVQRPRDHSGGHGGKHSGHVGVGVVLAAEAVLRPEIEDAVCAYGGRCAVVEIEEPNGAVDDREAHREKRVHGPHGQTVEGELYGLVGRLSDLPGDIGDYRCGQHRR